MQISASQIFGWHAQMQSQLGDSKSEEALTGFSIARSWAVAGRDQTKLGARYYLKSFKNINK